MPYASHRLRDLDNTAESNHIKTGSKKGLNKNLKTSTGNDACQLNVVKKGPERTSRIEAGDAGKLKNVRKQQCMGNGKSPRKNCAIIHPKRPAIHVC